MWGRKRMGEGAAEDMWSGGRGVGVGDGGGERGNGRGDEEKEWGEG